MDTQNVSGTDRDNAEGTGNQFGDGVEDVQAAVSAGRSVRGHGPYGVLIGNECLEFTPTVIDDPVPTGAQILDAAGVRQPVEHIIFLQLGSGLLEELRPDETVDLRAAGAEKFLVFASDRTFRMLVNDRAFDWGAGVISGATLKKLAGVDSLRNDLWQDKTGGVDRLVEDTDFANLAAEGVERFVTKPVQFRIVVNAQQREVDKRKLSYWEIVRLAFPEAVPAENIIYSVDYDRGPRANPEGSMVNGQEVQLKNGMTFYVTPTDKS